MNGSTLTLTLAAALAAAGLTRRGGANRATLTPGLRQVSGETFYWSTDRLVSPGFEVPQAVPRDTPVEDVFERVRQRAAPQAPSRLRCVYVCPKLGRGFCSGRRHEHVYKVKVWGKVFTTDGGFWTEAVFRPSHAEGFAESYWSPRGDVMINHAEETLVEGRVVVVSKASTGHQGSRAAPKLAVQDGADWRALGERVKAWTDTNASYDMLDATPSTAGGTWLSGGCRALASGLVKAYPDLRLAGLFDGEGRLQHVLAATPGGSFLDADGLSTHEALVRRWSEEEVVVGPVRLGPVTKDALTRSEIPAAPSLSARIANLFRSGSRAARKPKPTTLSDLNLPTTWFHGTAAAFTGPLRPNKGMGGACVWLADREGAQAYAQGQHGRLIEVRLAPDTKVVDLSNASDPIVREFIRLDRSASNMLWHGREEVTDAEMADAVAAWERRSTHYDAIEARGWAKGYFRKAGADALLVRDVKGWGGHQAMPSLCVLNRGKIAQQKGATP